MEGTVLSSFRSVKIQGLSSNRTLCVKDHPGILYDIYFDEKGDLDRESFLVKIEDQKPVLKGVLEPLDPSRFRNCEK